MARARMTKQVLNFPSTDTDSIANAKTNYAKLGWTLLKEWVAAAQTYLVFYKVLTN